jgi:hypothetical protein
MAEMKNACAVLAACLVNSLAHAAVIYVDDSAVGGENDGSSWADAFRNIRPALAEAQPGDVVRVAQGLYTPANAGGPRDATIEIPDGVRVIGGHAGFGAPDPDAFDPLTYITIFSGDLNGDDGPDFANDDENSFHVVTVRNAEAPTLLRGVTIRSGKADDSSGGNGPGRSGGGMLCLNSDLTLRDCTIENNRAEFKGGGISDHSSAPSIIHMKDCTVRGNEHSTSVGGGGGVSIGNGSTFVDCVFEDNTAPSAGRVGALLVSDALILRCQFVTNQSSENSGAVLGGGLTILDSDFISNSTGFEGGALRLGGECLLRNCLFDDNTGAIGGAIHINQGATVDMVDCIFSINQASNQGGAIANFGDLGLVNCDLRGNFTHPTTGNVGGAIVSTGPLRAVNCLFSGNTAAFATAAIAAFAPTRLINCTIVGNEGSLDDGTPVQGVVHFSGSGALTIHNCIFWGNTTDAPDVQGQQLSRTGVATVHVRNTILEGWTNSFGGPNNNADDPLFVDADGADNTFGTADDDPRLTSVSPARNTGNNTLLPRDDFDLDDDGNTTERISFDLDGERRIRQSVVDRGAFEFRP